MTYLTQSQIENLQSQDQTYQCYVNVSEGKFSILHEQGKSFFEVALIENNHVVDNPSFNHDGYGIATVSSIDEIEAIISKNDLPDYIAKSLLNGCKPITTLGKYGSVGLGYLYNGHPYVSTGNGFAQRAEIGPFGTVEFIDDDGETYRQKARSLTGWKI